MTSKLSVLACLLALCTVSHAQPSTVRPFVGVGLTGGGDEIANFQFTNGSDQSVTAGGLFEIKAGVDWRLAESFALRGSFGYHADTSNARNGSFRFERYPVELIGFWQTSDRVRLGLGVRKALSARTKGSGLASGMDASFTSSLGGVFEGEYYFSPWYALYGRAVVESYTNGPTKYSGNHVGVGVSFYY